MPDYPVPETLEVDGHPYETFIRPNGEGRMWTTRPTPAQAGDVGVAKPYPLEFSGGFGFSRRYTEGTGQRLGAGHYAWSENVLMQYRALFGPAPRISYLNMAADITPPLAAGFRLGGYVNSRLGGGSTVTVGGVEGADESASVTGSPAEATGAWTTPENILIDDDTYAEAVTEGISEYLRASLTASARVDASIPFTAIRARVRRRSSATVVAASGSHNFLATGAAQTFTVPALITSIEVDLRGAAGFGGARGARVQTTLTVTPGEELQINPGGIGTQGAPAFGGGQRGGGGGTDVRRGGTTLADRVAVAGGAGGKGNDGTVVGGAGGAGGENGANGSQGGSLGNTAGGGGGTGGTQGAGGSSGGALGVGGNSSGGFSQGGGGGGGYYGGGAGGQGAVDEFNGGTSAGGGGGGGSSYSAGTDTTFTDAYNTGAGSVTITWAAVDANSVIDNDVRLWVDGVITGSNKAVATAWTDTEVEVEYEWPYADIQSLGLTAADANGAIGIVISATVGSENTARIEHVDFDFSSQTISGAAALGGGLAIEEPQFIREFGAGLYVGAGYRTFTLDPSALVPTVEETHDHGNAARARSADVFDNQLVVALGTAKDLQVATSPWDAGSPTVWEDGTNRMTVVKTGGAGRLFTARDNLVFNVESGQPPTSAASYFPSTGETISDETDPVRALDEYLGGLVAGTVEQVRTIDPDAGFLGRGLTPRTRVSFSPWSGRSLIAIGSDLYFFTQRAAWLFRPGQPPMHIGFEELDQNNTPFIEGTPGIPDFDGQLIYVPYLFDDDSVIFTLEVRKQGDVGEGAVGWHSALYLEGRRCRMVRYWGGSPTREARLFFGAATDDEPESIGWVDLGNAPGPFFFRPGIGAPAPSSVLTSGLDDFGRPGVRQGLDRIEVPRVENEDADNFLTLAATVDGSSFTALGLIADAPVPTYRPYENAPVTGTEIGTRWTFTNPGTSYVLARGTPMAYLYDMPTHVEERTTLLDVPDPASRESAEEVRARLATLIDAEPFRMKHTAGRDIWARMRAVDMVEYFDRTASEQRAVFAVKVVFVEVEVAVSA